MKRVLILLISAHGVNCTPVNVYICDSKTATKYHLKANCRGLSNCQYHINKTTLEEAEKRHKHLCEWEDSKDGR